MGKETFEVARIACGADVDPSVRRELRSVHRDEGAVTVGQLGDLVDRGDEASHVGGAAHCDEADPAAAVLERLLDGVEVDVAVRREANHAVPTAVAPRQQVRVMLHLGHEHLAAVEAGLFRGDAVQRVGCALDEDDHLALLVDIEKFGYALARLFVSVSRQPRFVPGATVDT